MISDSLKYRAFQFYPEDWLRDPGVRSLTPVERDLWLSMLCIMHDCEPRGCLAINGRPMSLERLANALAIGYPKCEQVVTTLLELGVASRDEETGFVYDRRMRRDSEIIEKRRFAGGLGGNPILRHAKQSKGLRRKDCSESSLSDANHTTNQMTTQSGKQSTNALPTPSGAFATALAANNKDGGTWLEIEDDDDLKLKVELPKGRHWIDFHYSPTKDEWDRLELFSDDLFPDCGAAAIRQKLEDVLVEFRDYWLSMRELDIKHGTKRGMKSSWYLAFRTHIKSVSYWEERRITEETMRQLKKERD